MGSADLPLCCNNKSPPHPLETNTAASTTLPRMTEITPARDTPVRDPDLDEKFNSPSQLEHGYDDNATKYLTDREGAIAAESAEQQMTFKEAIRDYPAAVFWSFAISLCIIMEGYDTALPVSGVRRALKDPTDRAGQLCRHPSLPREVWRVCQRGSWLSTHSGLAIWPRTMLRCRVHPVSRQRCPACVGSRVPAPSLPLPGSSRDTATAGLSRSAWSPCFASSSSFSSPKTS